MIKKILIAEDHESANFSIRKTILDLGFPEPTYAYYCDDALLQAKKAIAQQEPFDLLITDLSFEEDHREQEITCGKELIKAIRALQANIKVIVFSSEGKIALIEQLFKDLNIDAYVRKARRDVEELKNAFVAIQQNKKYVSETLRSSIQQQNTYTFNDYDIKLISLLAKGVLQKDIPQHLEQEQIKPSGLSSVEKRLNLMRETLDFTKNEQLIAFCKDMGVI
jgi:two-component system capsular synthesis response regulator RcsB